MNKEALLAYINSGRIDKAIIIKWYCWEKGKDPILTEKFIKGLQLEALYNGREEDSLLNYCYEYALTYYIMKYNIILAYDKNGKFIEAF